MALSSASSPHQRLGLFNPILTLDAAFEGTKSRTPQSTFSLAPGSDLLEMIDAQIVELARDYLADPLDLSEIVRLAARRVKEFGLMPPRFRFRIRDGAVGSVCGLGLLRLGFLGFLGFSSFLNRRLGLLDNGSRHGIRIGQIRRQFRFRVCGSFSRHIFCRIVFCQVVVCRVVFFQCLLRRDQRGAGQPRLWLPVLSLLLPAPPLRPQPTRPRHGEAPCPALLRAW